MRNESGQKAESRELRIESGKKARREIYKGIVGARHVACTSLFGVPLLVHAVCRLHQTFMCAPTPGDGQFWNWFLTILFSRISALMYF